VHVGEVLFVLENGAPRVLLGLAAAAAALGTLSPLRLREGPALGTALGSLEGRPLILPVDAVGAGGAVDFLDHLGGC